MKDRRTTNPNDCTRLQSVRQAILPQNRHPICCGDCTGRSTNVAFLPVQRLEMVGLLIPAVDDYTIEQRKPDTQQGTTPQPRPADGVRCAKLRLPRTGRRLRGWRTALISTGTACRAPSAGRRLRGWRTARIRVRARHAVPHDATPVQRDDASATRYHAATADKTPACNAACGAGSDAASAPPSPARRRDTWAVQMFAADEGVAVCWIVGQEKRAACVSNNHRYVAPEMEMPC